MRAESIFNRWTNFYWNFLFLYLDQFITKLSVSLFAYSVVKVDTRRLRVYTMLQFNFIIYFKRTWIYPITAWAFNKLLFGYFFSLQGLLGFLLRSVVRAVLVGWLQCGYSLHTTFHLKCLNDLNLLFGYIIKK